MFLQVRGESIPSLNARDTEGESQIITIQAKD